MAFVCSACSTSIRVALTLEPGAWSAAGTNTSGWGSLGLLSDALAKML